MTRSPVNSANELLQLRGFRCAWFCTSDASIHFDAANHQDWFFGASTDNDTIVTGTGNNTIFSGAGNDTIDGGGGTNTVVYAGDITDYSISVAGSELVVTRASGVQS